MREDEASVNHVSVTTEVAAHSTAAAGVMSVNEPNEVATLPQIEMGTTVNKDGPALACRQCRTRKVRCDSAKPLCKNCVRRSDPCEYDVAPNRRGPDKQPGTRRRLYKKKAEQTTPPQDKSGKDVHATGQRELQGLRRTNRQRHEFSPPVSMNREARQSLSRSSSTQLATGPGLSSQRPVLVWGPLNVGDATDRTIFDSEESLLALSNEDTFTPGQRTGITNAYPRHQARYGCEVILHQNYIPRGPSSSFAKQTWWENLLRLYSDDASQGALKVYQDLSFVLNSTVYWMSCIHFPHFMDTLCNPNTRALVQPSVVLSALAVSMMMRSSEIGLGSEGRELALYLRDAAQSSLDASISACWIEPSLAQAAFFLALFEAALNPVHSEARISSSMFLLDSLIRALSLTKIDANNPSVTTFPADDMPCVGSPDLPYITLTSRSMDHSNGAKVKGICTCKKISLVPKGSEWLLGSANYPGSNLNRVLEKENFSVSPDDSFILVRTARLRPDWPAVEDTTEIMKEESRRLCWDSLMLAAFVKAFTPLKLESFMWNFHFTDSKNFSLLFPGESVSTTDPKISVWALHSRAVLLWSSCQKLVSAPEWQSRRAELASKALMEANIIESELRKHMCPEGHETLPFGGQGHLMQIKLLASNHFMPATSSPHRLAPHRSSVEQWLALRARISRHVAKMSSFLSRFGVAVASRALAKRPLSVWAAMQQVRSGIDVWKSDHSLTVALEQSLQFLPAVDFMSVMWPSEMRLRYNIQLRKDLMECCEIAGINPPAAIHIPGLAELKRKLGLSTPLPTKASFADILMAPLD